ncbi:uncharacterized protein Eint_090750 [Encephalitozoon intestinalis ATCC 50506]|uniref:PDEase domain-containing protein n=1 Tax=Encephalitozoon intestinalis (strain ATCC 50506) TaxID=876142 RepID=E0S9E0_ENCIT|nr:uncharacterized protein Eint_090750 [Encephalitozoon intestinalis ATCC 50506]ADM12204.1 hypothetical protein Eint_090750 [Encephalitozoon intestinalis ATCC 50506]UTX46011.1 cGMP-dependent 3',5'-cyclic phosphodiesterase [Encephalitozoon intestinalis]
MNQDKEISKDAFDVIIRTVQDRKDFGSKSMEDLPMNLFSYRFFHLEEISLADGISAAIKTILRDSRFSLLGVSPETLDSFFSFSFFHMLPHKYHNLDHLINTLYFGDFILQRLEKKYSLPIMDKMCLMIALVLHDIGHPGEKNREKIERLSSLYGNSDETMSFELIHATICKRIISKYRHALFGDLEDEEMREKLNFIKEMIFATDLKMNKEIIEEFNTKYFEERKGRKIRNKAAGEISEIELKMIVKIADLGSCYKDYRIFNKNSIAFWSEMYDDDNYRRTLQDISEDVNLLEKISIPLADSFSLVFEDFRFLYNQALSNLEEHKKYYKRLEEEWKSGPPPGRDKMSLK